jgi:hypothetical protein
MCIEPPKIFAGETLQVMKESRQETEEYFSGIKAPYEVSPYHFLVIPSHFPPQKVRGFVVGVNLQRERKTIIEKYS